MFDMTCPHACGGLHFAERTLKRPYRQVSGRLHPSGVKVNLVRRERRRMGRRSQLARRLHLHATTRASAGRAVPDRAVRGPRGWARSTRPRTAPGSASSRAGSGPFSQRHRDGIPTSGFRVGGLGRSRNEDPCAAHPRRSLQGIEHSRPHRPFHREARGVRATSAPPGATRRRRVVECVALGETSPDTPRPHSGRAASRRNLRAEVRPASFGTIDAAPAWQVRLRGTFVV